MDRYVNYSELSSHEREGWDYRVHVRLAGSPFAIVAPHGGRIERGTMQIADAVAGNRHSFYCFEGLKVQDNSSLHITSNRFDEPRALAVVSRIQTVISIHGARGKETAVYLGGRDHKLRAQLIAALTGAGFRAMDDPSPTRQGRGATNICNRGRSGRGVQFELPVGLRQQLFDQVASELWVPNRLFQWFVGVVREVLECYSIAPPGLKRDLYKSGFL